MTEPIFRITDGNPETAVNFLDPVGGLLLDEWVPATPDYKGGGVWAEPLFSDGRFMVEKQLTNVIESISFHAREPNPDLVIDDVQNLRNLLEKASSYFVVKWLDEPVWIEARARNETNIRYALIYAARVPHDSNPYSQPFNAINCNNVMEGLDLILERGHWQSHQPGTAVCIQTSGQEDYLGGTDSLTDSPAASTDDADWDTSGVASYSTARVFLTVGESITGHLSTFGVRFPTIAIPQGATIAQAFVTFEAQSSQAGTSVWARIIGELDNPDIGAFALGVPGYNGALNRLANYGTANQVNWNIPATTAGVTYNTSDIASIIQELVDQSVWSSGDDVVLYLETNTAPQDPVNDEHTFYAEDDPTNDAPLLTIYWTTTPVTKGPAASCADKVHVSNQQAIANITHIFRYDSSGASFSANLVGSGLPYDLYPTPVDNGDRVYFGCDTSDLNDGPFNNLIFNLSTAATYGSGDYGTWQYWNGAGWQTLGVQDNTKENVVFDKEGANGVFWEVPTDWAAVAINAVTAWWVRVELVEATGITTASVDDEDPYSVRWAHCDVAADQLTGELPTLLRMKIRNTSDGPYWSVGSPRLHATRVLMGSRSVSRGSNFTPYLNISDEQLHSFISVNLYSTATIAFGDNIQAPTSRHATGVLTNSLLLRARVTIDSSVANEYFGKFRALLRYSQSGGNAGDLTFQLVVSTSYFYVETTEIRTSKDVTDFQVLDMGEVDIPGIGRLKSTDRFGDIRFDIWGQNDNVGSATAELIDLILIPVDEFAADFISPFDSRAAILGKYATFDTTYLDVDHVLLPGKPRTLLRNFGSPSAEQVASFWATNRNGLASLATERAHRLWFFFQRADDDGDAMDLWTAAPEIGAQISLDGVQRYKSSRGAN